MTLEIVDIGKVRKIDMADELIGCLMEHVLRGNGLGDSWKEGRIQKE